MPTPSLSQKFTALALATALLTASTHAMSADRTIHFTYKTDFNKAGIVNCDLLQRKNDPFPGEETCPFLAQVDALYKGATYTCRGAETVDLLGIRAHSSTSHGIGSFQYINLQAQILKTAGKSDQTIISTMQASTNAKAQSIYWIGRVKNHYESKGYTADQVHQKLEEYRTKQGLHVSLEQLSDGTYRVLYDPGEDAKKQCHAAYPELTQR